jgi:hypothetical protein
MKKSEIINSDLSIFPCKCCDRSFDKLGKLQLHITSKHKEIKLSEYYIKYLDTLSNGKCKFCGEDAKFKGFTAGFQIICNKTECLNKSFAPFSKEYKIKVDGLTEIEYNKWHIQNSINKKILVEDTFKERRKNDSEFDKKNSKYCKEFWIKKGYSIEESVKLSYNETQKNRNKLNDLIVDDPKYMRGKSWNSKEYWMNKGFNEDESIKIVSEKQSTFSLKKCIKDYGEIEGLKIFNARQEKWKNTLDNKSDEEKLEILKKKLFYVQKVSNISQDLFNNIKNHFDLNESKYSTNDFKYHDNFGESDVVLNNKYVFKTDFIYKNKIIEFNGDYWHFNPKLYNENYVTKRGRTTIKAKSKWKLDKWRNDLFINEGYDLLIVWEKEYRENKKEIIKKCIEFLKN